MSLSELLSVNMGIKCLTQAYVIRDVSYPGYFRTSINVRHALSEKK